MLKNLQRLAIASAIFLLTAPAYSAIENNSLRIAPPQLLQTEQFSTNDVRFQSRGKEYTTYFTPSGVIVAGFTSSNEGPQYFELGMQLLGFDKTVEVTTLNPMLASNDQWLTTLPDYARIKYSNVYPGIDMICFGNPDQVKMQFTVAPGSNVKRIRVRLTENNHIKTTPDGGLELIAGNKTIRMPSPVGYQTDANGARQPIDTHYVINSNQEISIQVGSFDPTRLLIINP